ncbi:MAG: RES family NAD+ phosphorylase [Betaproteobacteria bacterium]|nr:RES family NAD+ phosphorylase [Betaproteobacteria bacterium]
MRLWRIAAKTRKYPATDLSGAGAAQYPGRWNDDKEPVVYCAPTIAMAVLETAAHVDDSGLPLNRFLVAIEVPDGVWARREEVDVAKLPPTWAAIPAGRASVRSGSAWLASVRSNVLMVPSVIVPEEWASLINPRHPDTSTIVAKVVRLFEYNRLFRS